MKEKETYIRQSNLSLLEEDRTRLKYRERSIQSGYRYHTYV